MQGSELVWFDGCFWEMGCGNKGRVSGGREKGRVVDGREKGVVGGRIKGRVVGGRER